MVTWIFIVKCVNIYNSIKSIILSYPFVINTTAPYLYINNYIYSIICHGISLKKPLGHAGTRTCVASLSQQTYIKFHFKADFILSLYLFSSHLLLSCSTPLSFLPLDPFLSHSWYLFFSH